MARTEPPRVAVLGAGPIGIEAALYARRLGFAVAVYERGEVGEHLRRWGHVRLFTPFGMNATPLGLAALQREQPQADLPGPNDVITGAEHREAYLVPLTQTEALRDCLRPKTPVLHVGRAGHLKSDPPNEPRRAQAPFRLLVVDEKQHERTDEADVVLDCTGTCGRHAWLGDGGIPAPGERAAEPHIAYGLEDVLGGRKGHYAGKSVMVVGGGYSAATAVSQLAALAEDHPATWVIWLTRGPRTQPLPRIASDPLRERDRLAVRANAIATRGEGNVEYHAQSVIERVECHGPDRGFCVTARCAGREQVWEVERLIAHVGYLPDASLFRELHVPEPVAAPAEGPNGLRQAEPNFFVLGAKSFGRDSRFLLRAGFDQVRDAFALIAGRPGLDLYRKG